MLEFERMTADELEALPRVQTVFLFPVGAPEDHGPHLAMGLDGAEAARLCRMIGERIEKELPGWKAVLMPSAPLGVQNVTTALALRVRAHVLRDWLVDACRSLERAGFVHFVCFSGNLAPRTLTAIEDAGKIISRRGLIKRARRLLAGARSRPYPTLVSASSALTTAQDARRTPFWPDPAEHGGERDTSVALALSLEDSGPDEVWVRAGFPQLVAAARAPGAFSRLLARKTSSTRGYWGEPARATEERGRAELESTVNTLFTRLRAVWDGANPNYLFRSYYSVLPPNKSFAAAWLLTFALVVLFWIWVSMMTPGSG